MTIVQRRSSYNAEDPEGDYIIMPPPYARRSTGRSSGGSGRTLGLLVLLALIVAVGVFFPNLTQLVDSERAAGGFATDRGGAVVGAEARFLAAPPDAGSVLVSYSYFEKDIIQARRRGWQGV